MPSPVFGSAQHLQLTAWKLKIFLIRSSVLVAEHADLLVDPGYNIGQSLDDETETSLYVEDTACNRPKHRDPAKSTPSPSFTSPPWQALQTLLQQRPIILDPRTQKRFHHSLA